MAEGLIDLPVEQLRLTSLNQNTNSDKVECRCSCNLTNDTNKYIKRLNEDIVEEKDKLKPCGNGEYNCPTTRIGTISPHSVVVLMNKLRNLLCETEKYFREHVRDHPDCNLINEQRRARVYSSYDGIPREESRLDDEGNEFITRLRTCCSHMASCVKLFKRNTEDFQQLVENLKTQAKGNIVCNRNMKEPVVVEDVCQLLTDARQKINDTKRIFIEHLRVHTEITENQEVQQETEDTTQDNSTSYRTSR